MPSHNKPQIYDEIIEKWQKIVNLLARVIDIPAGLIMRVHPAEIEVFVSSDTEGNPYQVGSRERLNTGLYCETVMSRNDLLFVPDALADSEWDDNPDLKLNMISYLGFPLLWSDGEIFGTICVLDNKSNRYSDEHKALLQQFAKIVEGDLWHLEEIDKRHQAEEKLKQHQANLEDTIRIKTANLEEELSRRKKVEEELRDRENMLRQAVDNTPVILYKLDTKGICQFSMGAALEKIGLTCEQAVGLSHFEVYAHLPEANTSLRRALEGETVHFTMPAEGVMWDIIYSPVWGDDNEITGVIGLAIDITERTIARDELLKLSSAVEQSPASVIITDLQGTIQYVNPKFTEVTGYGSEEVKGKNPRILKSGHTSLERYTELWDTITAGNEWHGEFHNKKKNGELFWEYASISPIRNANGQITHFVGIKEDITERKQLEQVQAFISQREWGTTSKAFFETLIVFLGELLDLEYAEIAEYFVEDNVEMARTVAMYAHGEIVDNITYVLEDTPCQTVVNKEYCCYTHNIQQLFPHDSMLSEMNAESYVGVPLFSANGKPLGLIALLGCKTLPDNRYGKSILRSVSTRTSHEIERMRNEKMLNEINERFRLAFHTSPDSININRLEDGMYIDTNEGFTSIMGYSRDEVVGKTSLELNIWNNPDDRAGLVTQLREKGYCENLEAEFTAKDGGIRIGLMSSRVIKLGDVPCIISITRDITERKQLEDDAQEAHILRIELEKERELVELKDRILSIMSHDFRTPLAIIQTSSDLLSNYIDKMTQEKRIGAIHNIQQQVTVLTKMVDDILIIGRGRAGKTDFRPSEVELVQFCRLIFDQVQLAAETDHRFEFISNIAESRLKADGSLLQHILMNLLSNAVKYSPEKTQVTLKIDSANHDVAIMVSDEGIGIPEDDKDNLFEPFHRAGNVENIKGTGLGLSIVKQYVKLHGGKIEVESEEGKGSTFTVILPLPPADSRRG